MSLSSSVALFGGVSPCRNALNYLSSSSLASFHSKLSLRSLNLNHRTKPSFCYADNSSSSSSSSIETTPVVMTTPMLKKRKRYRKLYPGENEGITQEMRFVAMKLRNNRGKYYHKSDSEDESGEEEEEFVNGGGETWVPSIEGFVKYLVDCKLVFDTLERIVDESSDVSYAYFRKTGLERSQGLSKDLERFVEQDILIPEPSSQGVSYATYLEGLAEKSAPLFLSHFYNVYFSHIAGGQVITKQVSEKLLEGKELEFCRWEGDAMELLKGVREKMNMLGEHWSRDEKNKCLREAKKSFRFMGQIVRLIIL